VVVGRARPPYFAQQPPNFQAGFTSGANFAGQKKMSIATAEQE
jgi:hypothetical protein